MSRKSTQSSSDYRPASSDSDLAASIEHISDDTASRAGSAENEVGSLPEEETQQPQRLRVKLTTDVLETYVDIFNASTRPTSTTTRPLRGSYIGHSHWSAIEKERFFASLQSHGAHDLASLAVDVGTKSLLEIRSYILALQDGVNQTKDESANLALQQDDQAAHDISEPFTGVLDEISEAVETNIHDQLCAADRARYGEHWIIDEARAQAFETELALEVAEETTTDRREHSSSCENRDRLDFDALGDGLNSCEHPPSFELLQPIMFVRLMRDLFMNSNQPKMDRWDRLPIRTLGSNGPSLLRSAFEDVHQIVLSLTRRLVLTASVQAVSRLRASHDTRVIPTIRALDVLTALDILNMRPQLPPDYWYDAVIEKKVDVFSRSAGLREGRMPNLGFRLTTQELRQKLQVGIHSAQDSEDGLPSRESDEASAFSQTDKKEDRENGDTVKMREQFMSEEAAVYAQNMEMQDIEHSVRDENALRHQFDLPLLDQDVMPSKRLYIPRRRSTELLQPHPMTNFEAEWEQPSPSQLPSDSASASSPPTRPMKKRRKIVKSAQYLSSSSDEEPASLSIEHASPTG